MTFAAYLKFTLTHTSMTMGYEGAAPGHGFELGVGGYVYAALLILGFSVRRIFCLQPGAGDGVLRSVQPLHEEAGKPDAVFYAVGKI